MTERARIDFANIHVRIPSAAETGARTLTALHPGRFVLGLGVSHAPLVEYGMGGVYSKPLATMRDYLEKMAAVAPQIEPGAGRPPRLLAALGPKMIELSGELADGAHPYLVTPEQTRVTREILGPDKWVVSEQAISITGDDDAQLAHAHAHLDVYSGLPPTGPRTGRYGQRRERGGGGPGTPGGRRRPRRRAGTRRDAHR